MDRNVEDVERGPEVDAREEDDGSWRSLRRDWSSASASSSRLKGFDPGGLDSDFDGVCSRGSRSGVKLEGSEGMALFCSFSSRELVQSQPMMEKQKLNH